MLFSDFASSKLAHLIKLMVNVKVIKINLRSWGYHNDQITDLGLIDLFEALAELKNLRELDLGLRGFAYNNNNCVSSNCINTLIKSLPSMQKL